MEQKSTSGKSFVGTVTKVAMEKTATVRVDRYEKHPKYKKYRKLSKQFLAHNPDNTYQVGDSVTITESKPLSKRKRFIITAGVKRDSE